MREDDQVMGEIGKIIEDRVTVAMREVGRPTGKEDAGTDETVEFNSAVEMGE